MGRMSARYVGKEILKDTAWVYKIWEEMGIVFKDKFGTWNLTDLGKELGGKMSKSNHTPVPTFDLDFIIEKMNEYLMKTKQ